MIFQTIFFNIIIFSIVYFVCKKFQILQDKVELFNHKKFVDVKKEKYAVGGISIFLALILLENTNQTIIILSSLFILIGIISDLDLVKNPIVRLLVQIIFSFFVTYYIDLKINYTNVFFIDYLIQYNLWNTIFTIFCLIVLINGTNFIDGINTLASGYYLIISIIIYYLSNQYGYSLNFQFLEIIIASLFVFVLFNIFGLMILGDSGSYFLSFLLGIILINFANQNTQIAPLFIVNLLWYPAFENLFTIIRRKFFSKSKVSEPDTSHLHQMILSFLKNRNETSNTVSGIFILSFNSIFFIFSLFNHTHTKNLLSILIIQIIIYLGVYFFLKKRLSLK